MGLVSLLDHQVMRDPDTRGTCGPPPFLTGLAAAVTRRCSSVLTIMHFTAQCLGLLDRTLTGVTTTSIRGDYAGVSRYHGRGHPICISGLNGGGVGLARCGCMLLVRNDAWGVAACPPTAGGNSRFSVPQDRNDQTFDLRRRKEVVWKWEQPDF